MEKGKAKEVNEKTIVEAIAYLKEVRKQAPEGNHMITDHLDEWEKMLHEALFNSAYQKSRRSRKGST